MKVSQQFLFCFLVQVSALNSVAIVSTFLWLLLLLLFLLILWILFVPIVVVFLDFYLLSLLSLFFDLINHCLFWCCCSWNYPCTYLLCTGMVVFIFIVILSLVHVLLNSFVVKSSIMTVVALRVLSAVFWGLGLNSFTVDGKFDGHSIEGSGFPILMKLFLLWLQLNIVDVV